MTTAATPQSPLFLFDVNLPNIETSLSSKAMLCGLNISRWSGYRYDQEASEEIAQIHGAEKDSGRFNKRLVPRNELTEITQIIGQARRDHEFLTLPWEDDGKRVLPGAIFMDHAEKMRCRQVEFWAAYARLASRFEELVRQQNRLGTLFKVEDYPGMRSENGVIRFAFPEELKERFSFKANVRPISNENDFRVSIGDQERERIKRQIAEDIRASLRVGTRELWQRLYKVVSHMSKRMAEYNGAADDNKPKLYDSMVTNIVDLVDVLPMLNLTADTELDQMANEVRKSLLVDTKELRKSDELRSKTAQAAVDIAQRMAAYMGVPAPQGVS